MDFDSATRQILLSWNKINIPAVLVGLIYFFVTMIIGFKVFNTPETRNFTFIHSTAKSRSIHTILPAELIKLKYNPVWIHFSLIPVISASIGIINFLGNRYVLSFNWDDLWTQESLFLGMFFLSPLIAILASALVSMLVWSFILCAVRRRVEESNVSAQWKNAPLLLISMGMIALALYAWDIAWLIPTHL